MAKVVEEFQCVVIYFFLVGYEVVGSVDLSITAIVDKTFSFIYFIMTSSCRIRTVVIDNILSLSYFIVTGEYHDSSY